MSTVSSFKRGLTDTSKKQNLSSFRFLVNGVSYEDAQVPVLLQIVNGVPPAQLLPNGSIYLVGGQKSVEVSIPASREALGGPVSANCFFLPELARLSQGS